MVIIVAALILCACSRQEEVKGEGGYFPFTDVSAEGQRLYGLLNGEGQIAAKAEYNVFKVMSAKQAGMESCIYCLSCEVSDKNLADFKERLLCVSADGSSSVQVDGGKMAGIFAGKLILYDDSLPYLPQGMSRVYDMNTGKRLFEMKGRLSEFQEDVSVRECSGSYSFVDAGGNVVLEGFEQAQSFSGGLAAVVPEGGGDYGLIDKEGNWLLEPEFSYLNVLDGQHIYAVGGSGAGILDRDGNVVLPLMYEDVSIVNDGDKIYYQVKKEGISHLIEADSSDVVMSGDDDVHFLACGNGWFSSSVGIYDGNSYYSDVKLTKGDDTIELGAVSDNRMWQNNMAVERKDHIVIFNAEIGSLSAELPYVLAERNAGSYRVSEFAVISNENGKYGVMGCDGSMVLAAAYDYVAVLGNGNYLVSKGDESGVVDKAGEWIVKK